MEGNGHESTSNEQDKELKTQQIKDKLLDRFGKTAKLNPETNLMDIVQSYSFDDPQVNINMRHNCGEVSKIVSKTTKGTRFLAQANGDNPDISYLQQDVANGHATAFHAFVVDEEDMVWDPITNVWGDTDLETYLENLQSSGELVIGEEEN